jgi:quercetin dioxygenase-like cupin family protein
MRGAHFREWDDAEPVERRSGRSDLDGGCYVLTPDFEAAEAVGGWRILATVSPQGGSRRLSQYLLMPAETEADPIGFGAAEVVLFLAEGDASITIGSRTFAATPRSTLSLRSGERFAASARGRALIVATVCPPEPVSIGDGQGGFDGRFPERLTRLETAEKNTMGERFYHVLTSPERGADQVTQFIGGVARSRARPHRHPYEEAIYILSGDGRMWTETKKARVGPGDVIYLPREQPHSLECVSESLLLAGSFYPAGSPAVNY